MKIKIIVIAKFIEIENTRWVGPNAVIRSASIIANALTAERPKLF
ncbi:MAG: hypothetical protein WC602_01795 [archaeon]